MLNYVKDLQLFELNLSTAVTLLLVTFVLCFLTKSFLLNLEGYGMLFHLNNVHKVLYTYENF